MSNNTANNTVDLEIKWLKKTDCVYKIQKNLPLKNESGVGAYLCQVTCEDTIKEINISLKEAPGTEQASTLKLNDKQLTDNDRINQTYSVLLEVFSTLQKVLQTDRQGDEAAKNLDKQQQGCSEKGKGSQTDRQGYDDPNEPAEDVNNQQPGPLEKSKEQRTDRQDDNNLNEAGGNPDNRQPGPPDGDWTVLSIDINTSQDNKDNLGNELECLDQGQSQSPADSNKGEKKLQEFQIKKPKKEKKGATVFSILAGKINDIHKKFIAHLQDQIEDLTEAQRVEDSDVVLIFCPIVSRAGTDIDAALAKIQYSTASKLTVLVVLHHTFDPEKTISNSSKSVNRENLLTVDCLFYEDTGLLDCQRNSDALEESVNWLIAQGHTVGSSLQQRQTTWIPAIWSKKNLMCSMNTMVGNSRKQVTSGDNKKEKKTPTFSINH